MPTNLEITNMQSLRESRNLKQVRQETVGNLDQVKKEERGLIVKPRTKPCTSNIVVVEQICLFAAIEQAGNFSCMALSNSWTWYFKYRSIVVIFISLLG